MSDLLATFKAWWPMVVPMITITGVYWRFVQQTKEVEKTRAAEARRIEDLREGRDDTFRATVIELAQRVARETIETQQASIRELEVSNQALRKENSGLSKRVTELENEGQRLREHGEKCDAENERLRKQVDLLRGELRQLKQVVQSSRAKQDREAQGK